jgi:mono/diheme cytochrome c family protein
MSKRPFVIFGIFAALCLIVLPLWAIGSEGKEEAAIVSVKPEDRESKELFANNCGSCHTLAAAGTDGVVGPNLDDRLVPTGESSPDGYEGLYSIVIRAVDCGIQGRMPKDIVVGPEAQDVSAFVAAYAGQIGKGPTVDLATAERPEPPDCG